MHFHVPIYLERFGRIWNDADRHPRLLAGGPGTSGCRHFEVETYAWGVLPAELQQPDLAAGIAAEMRWLEQEMNQSGGRV